jgi:hypothetical protein
MAKLLPQDSGCNGQATYPEVHPSPGQGSVRLRVVEGNALLQVLPSGGQLSHVVQSLPQ